MDNHTRARLDHVKECMDLITAGNYFEVHDTWHDLKNFVDASMRKFEAVYDLGYINTETFMAVREELRVHHMEKIRVIEGRA